MARIVEYPVGVRAGASPASQPRGPIPQTGRRIRVPNAGPCLQLAASVAVAAIAVTGVCDAAVFNVPSGDVAALRDSINKANASAEPDVILLEPGIFTLQNPLLTITTNITFSVAGGLGRAQLRRDPFALPFGIATIRPPATVHLSGIDFAGGRGVSAGAILNGGVLILSNCNISGNRAVFGGGGGILNDSTGTLMIDNSFIGGNRSGGDGGGILNAGALVISNSTIAGNVAEGSGGGLANSPATGEHPGGRFDLSNVTITRNASDADGNGHGQGGGVVNCPTCTANMQNTIVAGNSDRSPGAGNAPDCTGVLTSEGYNLLGDSANCEFTPAIGDQVGVGAPGLDFSADNLGATPTNALLPGSPAIDAGSPAVPGTGGGACAASDQRGFRRPADGDGSDGARCDIGAFEFNAEPNRINDLLSFLPIESTFRTTAGGAGCPGSPAGKFAFVARLTAVRNIEPLAGLLVQVQTLGNDNRLLNADAGPGRAGATLRVPSEDGFEDGLLGAGEFVDVPFTICLTEISPFPFLVDVLGVVE